MLHRSNASLIVSYQNGAAVRLKDIGQIIDDTQKNKVLNRLTDNSSNDRIVLVVQPQLGANTVEIVDAIKAMSLTLQAQVPQAIRLGIFYGRSQSIWASIDDVKFSLVLSIALVVVVIFLFLRNTTATIIPSLALPTAGDWVYDRFDDTFARRRLHPDYLHRRFERAAIS